jgi:hypothetical protein
VTGDFDNQGLSLGVLQWNFGQQSLQPLLRELVDKHADVVNQVLADRAAEFSKIARAEKSAQMQWAQSIQDPIRHSVLQPWSGLLSVLLRTSEFSSIQVREARKLFAVTTTWCAQYGLWSQRAAALMFDIGVQNGSIATATRSQILNDIANLPDALNRAQAEVRRMDIVANRRADAARGKFSEDVRARKLCCAQGAGVVHGVEYDLKEQFGIDLVPFA